MNISIWLFIGAYLLFGLFVASAEEHYSNDGDAFGFCLVWGFWPIFLAGLVIIAIFCIPYILGKWTGLLLRDLVRLIK